MEHADLGGVGQVGAAAELNGVALAHIHHADDLAVLLTEEGDGALLLGLFDGHFFGHNVVAFQHGLVDQGTDLSQLLGSQGGEVGEVEAQAVRLHQRTGLVDVVTQHGPQDLVQQVGGGMGPHDGLAAVHVDGGGHHVAHLQAALGELAIVHELAALVLLHVGDVVGHALGGDGAVVGHLAAHLGVEGGGVQDHDGLHAGDDLVHQLVLGDDGHDLRAGDLGLVIAIEDGGGDLLAELHAGPAQVAQGLAGLPGADALGLHLLVEGSAVQGHALVLDHLLGQVHGEAIGIIELEGILAGELRLALGLVLGQQVGEDLHAAVDGLGKVLLLGADDLGDIVLLLAQVLVLALVLVDDGIQDLIQEGLVHAQQLAVAGSPAEQAA